MDNGMTTEPRLLTDKELAEILKRIPYYSENFADRIAILGHIVTLTASLQECQEGRVSSNGRVVRETRDEVDALIAQQVMKDGRADEHTA